VRPAARPLVAVLGVFVALGLGVPAVVAGAAGSGGVAGEVRRPPPTRPWPSPSPSPSPGPPSTSATSSVPPSLPPSSPPPVANQGAPAVPGPPAAPPPLPAEPPAPPVKPRPKPPPANASAPEPGSLYRPEPPPAAAPAGGDARPETKEKRRWALTAAIVVVAAGATAARGMRRAR
jgi:hypothetical protein